MNPANSNGLVMTPAERYDVICDSRRFAGQTLLMTNTNPAQPGIHAGAAADASHADHREAQGVQRRADERPGPGSLPVNPKVTGLTSLGPPKLSGASVPRLIGRSWRI